MSPSHQSFEDELDTVIGRHYELIHGEDQDAARIVASLLGTAQKLVETHGLNMDLSKEAENVVHASFPDDEVLAVLGDLDDEDWLENTKIDVSKYTHIRVGRDN